MITLLLLTLRFKALICRLVQVPLRRLISKHGSKARRSGRLSGNIPKVASPFLLVNFLRHQGRIVLQIQESTWAYKGFSAKKMKVDELIALGGATPPTPSSPPSVSALDEITRLYNEVYSRGLCLFFESKWYELSDSRASSTAILHHNPQVVTLFKSFLQHITDLKGTELGDMRMPSHLEACLIWALACLPGSSASQDKFEQPSPAEAARWEAWHRVYVFETLISGDTLSTNPLLTPPADEKHAPHKHELAFWHYLAQYLLAAHSTSSPQDLAARERYLGLLRSTLDGRENRDVLYSIAILREYTTRWDAVQNEQTVPAYLDESDPRSKLAVATRFIRDEMAAMGGTTNVVRRLAELAYRSFVRPAVNVDGTGRRK